MTVTVTMTRTRACQASEMEPSHTDIKAGMNVLKDLAQKKYGPESVVSTLSSVAKSWCDLFSGGATLLSGNRKMMSVDDFNVFFRDQHGLATMKAIVTTRNKILKQIGILDKTREELGNVEDYGEKDALDDLLNIGLPPAWEAELSAQPFDDAVGFRAAQHHEVLRELSTKLQDAMSAHLAKKKEQGTDIDESFDYLEGYGNDGPKCWKADLSDDASLDDMYAAARGTILNFIPYVASKDFTDGFLKARKRKVSRVSR